VQIYVSMNVEILMETLSRERILATRLNRWDLDTCPYQVYGENASYTI
jgi:hypothetical protein